MRYDRARRSLDDMDGWLPAAPTAHLRSGAEAAARQAIDPGAEIILGPLFSTSVEAAAPVAQRRLARSGNGAWSRYRAQRSTQL